jgi:ABC-type transport system substrate-binding protein
MSDIVRSRPSLRFQFASLVLALAWSLASASAPAVAQDRLPTKLVFASAGFEDTNRFWMVSRPDHLQYDPFLETLLEVDPKTGEYVPRLAEKWSATPDYREWTFHLRKGVQFHGGFGSFTARDVLHSFALTQRQEAKMTLQPFWRGVEEVKVINDYQVVFRMKRPATTMAYAVSRAGDLRIVSKAQWDKEGLEGFDKRPAGTGSYQYSGRKQGISITFERFDGHWSEKPAFKELEFRIVREEPTRLAMLLSGEAHIADLPRELQKDAVQRGMKVVSSSFPVDWMTVYLGGQYYLPGDPAFKPDVAWTNKKVRQALNMAINRKELLATVFAGKGTLTYVTGWSENSERYNPEWASRFDKMYGFNPARAKELLKEAGYGPGRALRFKILAFTEPGESEGPQVAEALGIYYKEVGIETEIEVLDWAKVREMFRKKAIQCCIWPNIISWRPSEEWIRTSYWSKSPNHHYENEFVDKQYDLLTKAVNPQERERLARAIGDHLFDEFADIPLFWFANEVMANPKVVREWVYPGLGAGRSTHFHLVKPPTR